MRTGFILQKFLKLRGVILKEKVLKKFWQELKRLLKFVLKEIERILPL
jgi:hypothetical protein